MIHLYFLACIFFILLQGFFAASEISFISSQILKLRYRENKGSKRAKKVHEFILNPERFLATTLVGTNISVVLSTSLITFFLIRLGVGAANIWITFIFTPVIVIFAELIPKNIGRFFREDFSCKVVNIINFFEKLFLPIVKTIEISSKFLINVFVKKAKHRSLFVTKEEIKSLVREIEQLGGIDRGEKEAIEDVFTFISDKIKDVCTERRRIVGADYTDSYSNILDLVRKYRFTRYPVFRDKEVVGYINVYDLFYHPKSNWHDFIRPITKIGFNQSIQEAFSRLKSQKESIALVLKGKKTYGIITLQDITKEITTSIIKT